MHAAWMVALLMGAGACSLGCAASYMPLGDDRLFANFVKGSQTTGVDLNISLCMPDASVCGIRKVDAELYDPDLCWTEYLSDDYELRFIPSHYSNDHIEAGVFLATNSLTPEGIMRNRCNDLPYISIDIPPDVVISAPAPDAVLSRASSDKIRVEWSPTASFPMTWKLFPANNELDILPCDMLSWEPFEGHGEDLGFAEIPMDIIPADLPPEGCEVILVASRLKEIEPPSGLENSIIRSISVDGVVLRLIP